MKKCSRCKESLDEKCFSVDKRRASGLKSECKNCHGKYPHKKRGEYYIFSTEYYKNKLRRSGFSALDINDNESLVEVKKQLLILKRTIKWSSLKM